MNRAEAAPMLLAQLAVEQGDFRLDLALRARRGVTALLGPNGSGKTTALLTLAGLARPVTAQIRVGSSVWSDGEAGLDLAPEERSVGLVLAEPLLFPHLSLLDNVAFGPRSRGMPRRPARDRARWELDRVGLGELAGRRPAQVSSGQAQRAALARALATDPDLLLLDEPLSALDPQTRSTTRSDLAARLRDYDGVAIVTTHDPLDALTLADHLLFLEGGKVTQHGTPAEVVARPRTAYVASLVGLNLLEGTLVADAGDRSAATWSVALDADRRPGTGATAHLVLAEPPPGAAAGDPIRATINPEAVALFTERPATSARNLWPSVVDSVTVTGQRARVHLRGEVPLVADVTLGAVAALDIAPGRRLWAAVKATEVSAYLA